MRTHLIIDQLPSPVSQPMTATDSEDLAKITLGERFVHKGSIFKPDIDFYKLSDSSDLEQTARDVFNWIGLKPGKVSCSFADIQEPALLRLSSKETRIEINQYFQQRPYQCAALLTHMIMHYVLTGKHRYIHADNLQNELLTNQLAVEAGFGLVLIDGSTNPHGWIANLQDWKNKRVANIDQYIGSKTSLIQLFWAYQTRYNLHTSDYSRLASPWTKHLLKIDAGPSSIYSQMTHKRSRNTNLQFASYCLGMTLALIAFAYSLSLPVRYASNDIRSGEDRLRILNQRYKECIRSATLTRNSIDNSDLLQIRGADAKDQQCIEIETVYDNEYRDYKHRLKTSK